MQSLGAKLRQEREKRKIPLSKIAEETRISSRYLEALEADDLTALPGEFFYRAFVRQYSTYLGLDADAIDKDINVVSSRPIVEEGVPTPSNTVAVADGQISLMREHLKDKPLRPPQDDGMSKAWLVFAAAVIVACGAYFAWQNFTPAPVDSTAANKAAPVADEAKAPEPAPTQAKPEERKTEAAAAPVDLTPTAAQTLAAPAPALVKTASVAGPGEFSVTLVARQLTWIRITADGAKVFGGTIEAGEQKVINAKDAAEVIVGNAGTLDVIYNGKPLQYGVKGEVKTLLFNNGGWKFKPKPAESTPTPATPATTGGSAGDIGLGI